MNSEIIFGERQSHLLWTSFALDIEPETEIDLERSFQALSLNDEPTETEQKDPEETMAQSGSRSDAKEVKMNYPKIFTGDWNKFKRFLQDCELYLTINDKVYDTNLKKIGFVLALMNNGDAASWKEQFVENCIITSAANQTQLNMGTFLAFKHDLQEAFTLYDAPGDALEKMKNLRMKGDDSIDDHIAKFKMLVTSSGLGNTSAAVTDYYHESLPLALQKRWCTVGSLVGELLVQVPKILNDQ